MNEFSKQKSYVIGTTDGLLDKFIYLKNWNNLAYKFSITIETISILCIVLQRHSNLVLVVLCVVYFAQIHNNNKINYFYVKKTRDRVLYKNMLYDISIHTQIENTFIYSCKPICSIWPYKIEYVWRTLNLLISFRDENVTNNWNATVKTKLNWVFSTRAEFCVLCNLLYVYWNYCSDKNRKSICFFLCLCVQTIDTEYIM